MPVFILKIIYFIICIYIKSSTVSPIIVTFISYIIAPFYVMFIGIKISKFIFITTIVEVSLSKPLLLLNMFLEDDNLLILILIALGICLFLDVGCVRININECWNSIRFTERFIRIVT